MTKAASSHSTCTRRMSPWMQTGRCKIQRGRLTDVSNMNMYTGSNLAHMSRFLRPRSKCRWAGRKSGSRTRRRQSQGLEVGQNWQLMIQTPPALRAVEAIKLANTGQITARLVLKKTAEISSSAEASWQCKSMQGSDRGKHSTASSARDSSMGQCKKRGW